MKLKFDLGATHIIFTMFSRPEIADMSPLLLGKYLVTDMNYIDENNSLHNKLGSIPGHLLKKYHRPKKL